MNLKKEFVRIPQKVLLSAAAVGILLVSLGIAGQIVKNAKQRIAKLTEQAEYEKNRNSLLEEIQRLQETYARYKKRFPPTAESRWLMNQMSQLAGVQGLTLVSMQPEMLSLSQKWKGSAIKIIFKCGYHSLGAFVEAIENSPIFLRIHELSLDKISTERDKEDSQLKSAQGRVEMVIHTFLVEEK